MTKLKILRQYMKEQNLSAVVIPTADMHLSEYISEHFKLRQYISGFTGSAGTLAVTEAEAGLWTDGRYYIQAEHELLGSGISLYRASEKETVKLHEFLKESLSENDTVGLDGRLFSKKYLDSFISNLGNIKVNTDCDIAQIWENRPPMPMEKAFLLAEKYNGENVSSKISRVRKIMQKNSFTHYVVSAPECIMWLLNIRGNDVKDTPVVLSYLMISQKKAILYVQAEKLTREVSAYLKEHNIEVAEYEKIYEDVQGLNDCDYTAVDFSLTNYSLVNKIASPKKDFKDIIYNLKCVKNNVEIENIKKTYIKENVALTKAFYEIYHSENIDECDAVEIIERYRRENAEYISPSFDTIAAYGKNAAMMHYSPDKEKCARIGKNGLLLIDTGGQYFEGTTDTTRTLALEEISQEEKEAITLVLKGNISLASAVFPDGTKCSEIDALARSVFWKKGLDYRCSTGHGVGYLLGVHEGPQRLSVSCNEVLKVGMTITDEPGIYMENEYGIRTENHLVVREAFQTEYGKFLCFEVLNYCPIGTESLLTEILTTEEKNYINEYNKKCRELILPHLSEEESKWLISYTAPIMNSGKGWNF